MGHILECHEIVKTDFVHAENCYLYDANGKQFTDFESGIWCTALGHNHPQIQRIIEAQSKRLIHLGTRYPNDLAEQAAVDVLEVTGIENGKCVFLSSGSEAVEFGIQAIRRITEKPFMLGFKNSFFASYGSAGRKNTDEWYLFDWTAYSPDELEVALETIPFDSLAGFAFEPGGSGIGLIHFPPEPLVQEIARRVRQAGGLILANEITTGMGRTGKWFGFQHYEIQPDIVAIGKGLGNGYPVSAVSMSQKVADRLLKTNFHYAQSHQNDPLGCAVAREVIAAFRTGAWVEKGNTLGKYFLDGLKQLAQKYSIVKEARGRGMLLGLELQPRIAAATVYRALLEQGFLVGYYPAGNMLRFDPALTMQETDISRLLTCLEQILSEADKDALNIASFSQKVEPFSPKYP